MDVPQPFPSPAPKFNSFNELIIWPLFTSSINFI
jgi:hypothetical protein